MKNHTKLRKCRFVGMPEFNRFTTAIERLGAFCRGSHALSLDANGIVLKAEAQGQVNWGLSFGERTLASLRQQRRAFDAEFKKAALAFTGEKPAVGECDQDFFERIGQTFMDDASLSAMLARNNITFIGVGS